MKLAAGTKILGAMAAGLFYTLNAATMVCEFDNDKPICKKTPEPFCAHIDGCDGSPKEVCLDFRDRPGICLIAFDRKNIDYRTFSAKRSW